MITEADSTQTTPSPYAGMPLAWRISHNMQGCSPARIDSVIQVHLRQRERHPSQCPDTLEIPGLPAKRLDESAFFNFGQPQKSGPFTGDSLYHPELPPHPYGRRGVSLGYQLGRDDYVTGSLLVCLVLLNYALHHSRYQIRHLLRDFFYPPHERSIMRDPVSFAPLVTFSTMIMLSVMGGLIMFVVAQTNYNLFLSQVSPYLLLFIYMGIIFLMFLFKRMAQDFVGWVFFTPLQRDSWRQSTELVCLLQSAAIFPLCMVFLYFRLSPFYTVLSLFSVIVLGKLMLAWRARTILFHHFSLILHLFVYLCTLEIVPLLALWKILLLITDKLIVKY